MAVQHRKIGTGIERFCNLPVIRIKAGSIAELNCREAAYLNHSVHKDGEDHAACDAGVRGPERRFHFEIEARYSSFSWPLWSNASNEFSRIDIEKPF